MPKKYDDCVKNVQKNIKSGKQPKTYRCDSDGKPNKKGKHRCESNAYAICSPLRKSKKSKKKSKTRRKKRK